MTSIDELLDSAGEIEFREELRSWLDEHLPGGWKADGRRVPRDPTSRRAFLREWQAEMAEGRWVGIHWPTEFGGRSATLAQQIVYATELVNYGLPPLPGHSGLTVVGPCLIKHGTDEQRARWLERIRRADDLWASGFSEPEAGSDLAALRTRGVIDGDTVVINGQKIWTSRAHFADMLYTLIRTDPAAPKHRGISVVAIPLDSPGITVRPIKQITGDSEFNEVFFDDVVVDRANIIGPPGAGWEVNRTTLSHEHFTLFIGAHARLSSSLDKIMSNARNVRGPDGAPRSADVHLRNRIARSWCKSQLLVINGLRNVARIQQGSDPGPEGSISKLFGQETEKELFELALDVSGPMGVLDRGAIGAPDRARWLYGYLSSRAATIGGGTSEIHRSKVAEGVLGLPKDPGREVE